jgi:hypothetical protein
MLYRFAWNAYCRPKCESRWVWIAAGESFGSANAAGLLRQPNGERIVLFGRTLPDAKGKPAPIVRRPQ